MRKNFCGTLAVVSLAVVSLTACGGGYSSGPPPKTGNTPPPATNGISVTNNAFVPPSKTVAVGTVVQWAWNSCTGDPTYGGGGETCVAHSVTFDDGSPGSATQDRGTFSRTFNAAGVFAYHCTQHPTDMKGTITVQ
jgi:plastocyanin